MADKFPELDSSVKNGGGDFGENSDFLSREKELLGDEFATDQDKKVLEDESDEEISEFKEQFPEVEGSGEPQKPTYDHQDEGNSDNDDFEGFSSATTKDYDLSQSQPIKEWKERRDLEINEREKVNKQKKQDILTKAQQTIDDFYENYNSKKDQQFKTVAKDQEEFLTKRDGFLKNGTLWDRVNELIDNVGELSKNDVDEATSSRDKTKFKEILKKLKGKTNVPGAGGYQE
ncbi:clc1 [Candida oxycetoniae]|uniref:Clathrin light chain n=1 Tax=Candida oxycetoniae TaxID=497107 RepID=A0AAI9WW26_9ASCO|nr:clc1 [Candida oxycetoniae]KAI3402736.2 clc1 [Candida oxycetoniae]